MKAIRINQFGPPEVMQLENIDKPVPAAGQLLIKVEAIGVNPVETYVRSGQYPILPNLPFTPGNDLAGTIDACGPDCGDWKVGDRVFSSRNISGSYAEYTLCNLQQVFALPERASYKEGAAVGVPGAAAWRGLFIRGNAKANETVLIHGGSGSVGLNAIQLAKAAGLKVIATAGTPEGLVLMKNLGVDDVFNHRDKDYIDAIKSSQNGKGVALILEMLANLNLQSDLDLLAPRGRVVIIGSRGKIEIDPRATMGKETDIRGLSLFNSSPEETKQTFSALRDAMGKGVLKPVIGHKMQLSEAAKAHDMVMKDGNCGKIILIP